MTTKAREKAIRDDALSDRLAIYCGWKQQPDFTWEGPNGEHSEWGCGYHPNFMHHGNATVELLNKLHEDGWYVEIKSWMDHQGEMLFAVEIEKIKHLNGPVYCAYEKHFPTAIAKATLALLDGQGE